MYESVQEPLMDAMTSGMSQSDSAASTTPATSAASGQHAPNDQPLPNPVS